MQIHIAASTVIRGKMKHRIHAIHRGARHSRFSEISLNEINCSLGQWSAQIIQVTAREVVHDPDFCAPREQLIGKRRTDKRSTASNQISLSRPESEFWLLAVRRL